MFYLILAILLVLFYIFAAPSTIKGTLNIMIAVFLLVALFSALILLMFRILHSPPEIWLTLAMVTIGLWAFRDLRTMKKR